MAYARFLVYVIIIIKCIKDINRELNEFNIDKKIFIIKTRYICDELCLLMLKM
jgi:hypothetical protein